MNIREIANLLGVAPSTVSIVLNDKKGVGKELRAKITELLVQNGYRIRKPEFEPSTIEFLFFRNIRYVEDHHDDTFGTILSGVDRVTGAMNSKCTVKKTDAENLERDIERINQDNKIVGVLFMGSEYASHEPGVLEKCKKPIVVMDSSLGAYPINSVDMNNAQGIRYIFEHLKAYGHSKIGFVRSKQVNGCMYDRYLQVDIRAKEAGIVIDPELVGEVGQMTSTIGQEMDAYVSGLPYFPTAFVTANDFIALNLIKTLWSHGYRVPDDVSVIGYDDSPLCLYTVPRLTTVFSDFAKIGEVGALRLFEMIRNDDKDVRKIYVEAKFVNGESVKNLNEETKSN